MWASVVGFRRMKRRRLRARALAWPRLQYRRASFANCEFFDWHWSNAGERHVLDSWLACTRQWSSHCIHFHPHPYYLGLRLVAPGAQVVFRCVLNNTVTVDPHWVVNNHIALSANQKNFLLSGYLIDEITYGSVTTLSVKVNTTSDKNSTEMFCSSIVSDTRSNRARLLIVNGVLYIQ